MIWYEWSNMASSCVHSRKHEWSLTTISLEKKPGLDVMQSHPWCRMGFGQYHATSAVLGWPSAVLAFFPRETAISCTKCSQVFLTYFLMMSLASLDTSVKLTSGNLKRVYTPGGGGRNVHWIGITLQAQLHMCGLLPLILKPMYRDTAHRQISILGSPG